MERRFSTANLPALKGAGWALLAAAAFGASTPFVQKVGAGLGPLTTAALLYVGAAIVGFFSRRPSREARLNAKDWPRLCAMAVLGAGLGPVALAWGLQHTSGTGASLMLTLEAVFTAVLARWLYNESMDRRVWFAMALLAAGGMLLVLDQGRADPTALLGLLAVMGATACWGVDNSLSRALADRDPGQVVFAKSLLGCLATGSLAVLMNEPSPSVTAALLLLAIGASGYGLSLRFYLLAQRAFGAARTGSVFAFAPFIGAVGALALGDRSGSWLMVFGGLLMIGGILLHLNEQHEHPHQHEALEHDHAHDHSDGHHTHTHEVLPKGAHSHPHRHAPVEHTHAHVPDLHHGHVHK